MGAAEPTAWLAIQGPIARSDLPGLDRRACAALQDRRNGVLMCEVSSVAADAVAIDALARLQLAARRRGCQVRLRGASPELLALVRWMGLENVLPGE